MSVHLNCERVNTSMFENTELGIGCTMNYDKETQKPDRHFYLLNGQETDQAHGRLSDLLAANEEIQAKAKTLYGTADEKIQ